MNFVKKKASNSGVGSRQTKSVTVYYFYKTDIDDKMDEEILLARALDAINENEEFNIIKYIGFIWFGISAQCSTCIYLGLEDEDQSLDASTFLKLIDSHMWKLNAGYMYIENNYTKIDSRSRWYNHAVCTECCWNTDFFVTIFWFVRVGFLSLLIVDRIA